MLNAENSRKSFPEPLRAALAKFRWPPAGPVSAPFAHAEELVRIVKVAVTALLPETVVFGMEKQPFVREGLLVTVNLIVPV